MAAIPVGFHSVGVHGLGNLVIYEVAPGIFVYYDVDVTGVEGAPVSPTVTMDQAAFERQFGDSVIRGGSVTELPTITQEHGTYASYWNWVLDSFLGDNPARQDQGVLRVMALLAARPDMSQVELENRLQRTEYWQDRTNLQRQWNDLSPEEQRLRVDEAAAQLAQVYWQNVGQRINYNDKNLRREARALASGQKGQGQILEEWIRPIAEKDEGSPWSRTIQNERRARGQHGVDIENRAEAVRSLAREWGVSLSGITVDKWARAMAENSMSEADVLEELRKQADALYGSWKDPNKPTLEAAAPWLQAYEALMEKPGDLFNPDVQRALTTGMPMPDFQDLLRRKPEWMETQNAQDTFLTEVGDLGRRMGF